MFKKLADYCKDSYNEIAHKMTWPSRKELTHSAVVVLSASAIIAVIVFCMDTVFKMAMTFVYPH